MRIPENQPLGSTGNEELCLYVIVGDEVFSSHVKSDASVSMKQSDASVSMKQSDASVSMKQSDASVSMIQSDASVSMIQSDASVSMKQFDASVSMKQFRSRETYFPLQTMTSSKNGRKWIWHISESLENFLPQNSFSIKKCGLCR